MKRILLPTDFSENATNAIDYALTFFRGLSCEFYFLNIQKTSEFVLDDVMAANAGSSVYEGILDDNQKQLNNLIAHYKRSYIKEDYQFEGSVDYDVFTDAIKQLVTSKEIDLIIMGTNGASSTKEVLFGSNTLQVIRTIHCPVLIIPEGYTYQKFTTLLFSTHNRDDYSLSGMAPLKKIIDFKRSSIEVLAITDKDCDTHKVQQCIQSLLKGYVYRVSEVKRIPVPIAIDMFVQLTEISMHAMFLEKQSFLERFVFGSKFSKINYGTRVPLLILQKDDD